MKLRNKKTGEVFDAIVREKSDNEEEYSIIVCDLQKYRKVGEPLLILGEYDSLAKLYEEWEDYKSTEPQIKDEKIKKMLGEVVELELTVNELGKRFDEFNKHYTELCGEEEYV